MKKLLLLHGALGSKAQMAPLAEALKNDFEVHSLNFSGHGGAGFADGFGIQLCTAEVLGFLEENQWASADIFGYSMGGYVALNLASQQPERVGRVATLATKFDWTPEGALRETKLLDPEKIEAKVPLFAAQLHERHAPNDWKELLRKTADMMLELGQQPLLTPDVLSKIEVPCLICLGDGDQMVGLDESSQAAALLPNGRLEVLENTPHPFEKVDMTALASTLASFLVAV